MKTRLEKFRKMNQIFKLQIVVLCCFFSAELMADERWYQVDIIVFSQKVNNTEEFEQTSSRLDLSGNPAFLSQTQYSMSSLLQDPIAYAQVKPEAMLLNNTYNKLQRSSNYQPLLHVSWVQSARSNQVNRGVQFGVTGNDGAGLLNGILKIQRGHYLHLLLDMEYMPGDISRTQEDEFSEPAIYRIKEKRRFRLNEVHYLDHPKFGIIVTVKPLTI